MFSKTQTLVLMVLSFVASLVCICVSLMGITAYFDPRSVQAQPVGVVQEATPQVKGNLINLMGVGDRVKSFTVPVEGTVFFDMQFLGDGFFGVKCIDCGPGKSMLVADVGQYEGEGAFTLEAGTYNLEIDATTKRDFLGEPVWRVTVITEGHFEDGELDRAVDQTAKDWLAYIENNF